jgi:3-oxoacyl-[acyl-carrier protein] reductase
MELKGKVALVTGGSTGLGRSVSLALASQGAHVAINYIPKVENEANRTAAEIRDLGVSSIAVKGDVSTGADVESMVAAVRGELGPVDVLVTSAGVTRYVPLPDLQGLSEHDWDWILGVNLKGPFLCARAVAGEMVQRGAGKIVNISSNSAFAQTGSSIAYMVSKAAVVRLTQCLAAALSPHVQVNAVAPGPMDTTWAEQNYPDDVVKRVRQGRLVTVDDATRAVMFLLATDSINGQTIVPDFGVVMR